MRTVGELVAVSDRVDPNSRLSHLLLIHALRYSTILLGFTMTDCGDELNRAPNGDAISSIDTLENWWGIGPPFEICGNSIDDDSDGLVDGADPDCELASVAGAASPNMIRRLERIDSLIQPQDAGDECKVTVTLVSISVLRDNEYSDDEYRFKVKLPAFFQHPAIGEYEMSRGTALPHTIVLNQVIFAGPKGKKGYNVPLTLFVETVEVDTGPNDDASGSAVVKANCPNTVAIVVASIDPEDDINVAYTFEIIWDP